jgi:hypothetical protein
MDVYIVLAEHWEVPGLVCKAYATLAAAEASAVALVGEMVAEHNAALDDDGEDQLPASTLDTWEILVEELQEAHGAAHVDVHIRTAIMEGGA